MRIAFIHWYDPQGFWNDGLWAALQILREDYEIDEFNYQASPEELEKYDIVVAWGGTQSPEAQALRELVHDKKVLLYAGGELKPELFEDFTVTVLEHELDRIPGVRTAMAFGTNTKLFRPYKAPKQWDGFLPAAYAKWKRQELFGDALKERGLLCGPKQEVETECFEYPESLGTTCLPELPADAVSYLYNSSHATVVTATQYGGCQRAILESMACGVPVIVMGDAPKNRWYVEQAGNGFIVDPNPEAIAEAIEKIKAQTWDTRPYILENWSEERYAQDLARVFESLR